MKLFYIRFRRTCQKDIRIIFGIPPMFNVEQSFSLFHNPSLEALAQDCGIEINLNQAFKEIKLFCAKHGLITGFADKVKKSNSE